MKDFTTPGFLQPVNATLMRRMNRSIVLELIRQSGPIARSEISRVLSLSMPTVMRIVDELGAQGLIRPSGETRGGNGRPREQLEYNKDGYTAIGIDLGGTKLYGALANIGGEILDEATRAQHRSTGEQSFTILCELIDLLIHSKLRKGIPIMGIAVGVPGVTHARAGVVEWAPSLMWRNFPLKQRLEVLFDFPIMVENDVNLAALGEQWFGAGKGVNNMVLLAIGTGLGAGLIVDGAIYRGHTESAGEVGYMVSDPSALGHVYDGFGAMESLVSGTGISERAVKLLRDRLPADQLASLSASDVFSAARRGEDWATQIVNETADHLSIAIANIAALLDPELIVLGGGVANSGDLLIPAIQARIAGIIPHIPRIEASILGTRATAMGAVTMTVHTAKDYYVVRRLY
jgi:glucokinase